MPDSINNYNGPFRPLPANRTRKSDSVSNRIESNAFQFNEITRQTERERERGARRKEIFILQFYSTKEGKRRKGCLTLWKNCLFFHWNSKEGSLAMNERRLKAVADFRSNYFCECHFLAKLWNFLFLSLSLSLSKFAKLKNEIDSSKKSRLTFLRVSFARILFWWKRKRKMS